MWLIVIVWPPLAAVAVSLKYTCKLIYILNRSSVNMYIEQLIMGPRKKQEAAKAKAKSKSKKNEVAENTREEGHLNSSHSTLTENLKRQFASR